MKSSDTPGASNQLSQDSPAGVISRVLPMATISTWRIDSGSATAFGRRTAWDRLVRKTVVLDVLTTCSCGESQTLNDTAEEWDMSIVYPAPALGALSVFSREANSVRQSTGVAHRDAPGGAVQIQSHPDRHLFAGVFRLYRVESGSRKEGGETGVLQVVELSTTCRNGR